MVKPSARGAPCGTWVAGREGLAVLREEQLLVVPMELMGCDYLAYHQALTTAFRLLEGYGVLRCGSFRKPCTTVKRARPLFCHGEAG